jgi:hypothetical protein
MLLSDFFLVAAIARYLDQFSAHLSRLEFLLGKFEQHVGERFKAFDSLGVTFALSFLAKPWAKRCGY